MILQKDKSIGQCLENVSAWVAQALDGQLRPLFSRAELIATAKDRCFYKLLSEDFGKLLALLNQNYENFLVEAYTADHGETAVFSRREAVPFCAAQLTVHFSNTVEIDFDLCNPRMGAVPALGHLVEVLWPGKTDPWRVMKGLRRRGFAVRDIRKEELTDVG